jgi:hypothetical protein
MMKNEKIPQLYLEQALLDELLEEKKHLLQDEVFVAEVKKLEASNREILMKYDPSDISEKILDRLELEGSDEESEKQTVIRPSWFSQHRLGIILAAAALVIFAGTSPFLFRKAPEIDSVAPGTEITRIKGLDFKISLYRKSGESVEELIDGAEARESDLIQISYNAAGKSFGAIFSIDGRGVVSLHFPDSEKGSLVLERDGEVALDFSYRLDDAPDFERFFFVTSDRTFDLNTVMKAARTLSDKLVKGAQKPVEGTLDLPEGLEYTSMILKKEVSE